MSLVAPNLDDRTFQDLVDDAKRLVQRRCPTWTDHNVSDPGVTLIEAMASMVDQLLYRLNRVPGRHYLKLLESFGVVRYPPAAARAAITFWLTSPQASAVRVPSGTEVATIRTTADESLVFTTIADLAIIPCERLHVVTVDHTGIATSRTGLASIGTQFPCFNDRPVVGDALCIGLSSATPDCVVAVRIACSTDGVGVDPLFPPLCWEALTSVGWTPCEVDRDGTLGLNRPGDVVVHVPSDHCRAVLPGTDLQAGWLRCRLLSREDGQPTYSSSPRVSRVEVSTIGGTTEAAHAEVHCDEVVGVSDGLPAQRFSLVRRPVVDTGCPIGLESAIGDIWEAWDRVENFADSGPEDRHFILDAVEGQIEFGPTVRGPDGHRSSYGAAPPKGAAVHVTRYSSGGGSCGNVPAGAISVLKSSIPRVGRVSNRAPARGGRDGETAQAALERAPLVHQTSERAVTARDYEHIVRSVAPELARVHCLAVPDEPGTVRVLVVPALGESEQPTLSNLMPSLGTLSRVGRALDAARVVGSHVFVEPPVYVQLVVVATVACRSDVLESHVHDETVRALFDYFNPLTGGPNGSGWPLGRAVTVGDVYGVLQAVAPVDNVEDVRLFWDDPETGQRSSPGTRIDLDSRALVISQDHQVRVVRRP